MAWPYREHRVTESTECGVLFYVLSVTLCSLYGYAILPNVDGGGCVGLLNDRGAVEGNSRGSRAGERSEPSRDPRYLHPQRADRGAVAFSPEW